MSVKRYDFVVDIGANCSITKADVEVSDAGLYVTYHDYALLQSQNADLAVQLANAESKCRELAAESNGFNGYVNHLEARLRKLSSEISRRDAIFTPVYPDEATERDLFEEWVMEKIYISKTTLEGLRTDDGYRNSNLSGTDYNGMWSQWKAIRAAGIGVNGE